MAVLATSLAVGLTRFVPLSRTPWDWDEVLFCLAVGDYNVAAHQPHPAGFPLFILLGKIARFFADSDFHALQAVNVLVSLLVFPVMYAVARAFRLEFVPAYAAALVFSFLTNVWFFGGTAFSDPLAMLSFLAAVAAYMTAGTSTRRYLLASLCLAAGVLVRPQNALVAVFPWTLATFRLARVRNVRAIVAGTLIVVALAGIGYGIAAYVTDFDAYVRAVREHSKYVARADSLANAVRPPLLEVVRMQLDPFEGGKVMLALNALALLGIVFGRRHVTAEVLLTFAPFFLFCALAANPGGTSRFSLNYIAGVVILAIEGTDAIARRIPRARNVVHAGVVLVLLGRLIPWSLPAFDTPRATVAPPTAIAQWLGAHVPRSATLFVDANMVPWVRYYARDHRQVTVSSMREVLMHRDALNGWYVTMAPPPKERSVAFVRPRNRTWNIVTQRGFEAFAQPVGELFGFDSGWYNLEDDGTHRWRWSGRQGVILLGPTTQPRELDLRFHVPVDMYDHPVRVTVRFNGATIATIDGKADNELHTVVHGRSDRVNVLTIEPSETFVPAQRGNSGDERELGIMLQEWSWRPVAASAARRPAA